MILVVCLDDRNGMTFLNRRLSQDSVLRGHMLKKSRESILWMNGYSARQFDEITDHMRVDESFLELAGAGEFCFVENVDVMPAVEKTEKLMIYHWNRQYPSDVKFPMTCFEDNMHLLSREEFAGSSHEKITWEVYGL